MKPQAVAPVVYCSGKARQCVLHRYTDNDTVYCTKSTVKYCNKYIHPDFQYNIYIQMTVLYPPQASI